MSRFLQLVLINVLFAIGLGTAGALYSGDVHPAGVVAIVAVLGIYVVASAYALWRAWYGRTVDLELAVNVCPMVAMLGTVAGFLIAFSGATGDVQERVLGASTGLVSTFVGVACAIVLMCQQRLLR